MKMFLLKKPSILLHSMVFYILFLLHLQIVLLPVVIGLPPDADANTSEVLRAQTVQLLDCSVREGASADHAQRVVQLQASIKVNIWVKD